MGSPMIFINFVAKISVPSCRSNLTFDLLRVIWQRLRGKAFEKERTSRVFFKESGTYITHLYYLNNFSPLLMLRGSKATFRSWLVLIKQDSYLTYIGDDIGLIYDLMNHRESNEISGILFLKDLEKALDSDWRLFMIFRDLVKTSVSGSMLFTTVSALCCLSMEDHLLDFLLIRAEDRAFFSLHIFSSSASKPWMLL